MNQVWCLFQGAIDISDSFVRSGSLKRIEQFAAIVFLRLNGIVSWLSSEETRHG